MIRDAATGRDASTPPGPDLDGPWRYKAFISYSRAADGRLAPALERALRRFARPWYRLSALALFRDQTSLSVTPALWGSIEAALARSAYFILLASPQSAASRWVNQELRAFLANRSPDHLLIVLTEGEIAWDPTANDIDWNRTDALSREALAGEVDHEPRYLDLRWARGEDDLSLQHHKWREHVADLAATLHGRPKDEMVGEDVYQHRRRIRLAWLAGVSVLAFAVAASIAAWVAIDQQGVATREAARAKDEARRARQMLWVSEAQRRVDSDPTVAVALLREVDAATPAWRQTLIDALRAPIAAAILRHPEPVQAVAFSPDGARVATAAGDVLRIWPADGAGEPIVARGHEDTVVSVAFSPDGALIATASRDETARLWDAATGAPTRVLTGHTERLMGAVFSPDGALVATRSVDRTVRLWRVDDSRPPIIIAGESRFATFSPDSRRVATSARDLAVRVWSVDGAGEPVVLRGHTGTVASGVFTRDGRLITAAYDDTARVWTPSSGASTVIDGHSGSLAVSPDQRRIAFYNVPGNAVWIRDIEGGEPVVLNGLRWIVRSLAFSPDVQLVIASHENTARLWRTDGARPARVLRGHDAEVSAVSFSPDGARALTASEDGTVRVWSLRGPRTPIRVDHGPGPIYDIALHPDATRVASASWDRIARIARLDGEGAVVATFFIRMLDQRLESLEIDAADA